MVCQPDNSGVFWGLHTVQNSGQIDSGNDPSASASTSAYAADGSKHARVKVKPGKRPAFGIDMHTLTHPPSHPVAVVAFGRSRQGKPLK